MTITTPDAPRYKCVSVRLLHDLEAPIIELESGLSALNQVIDQDRSDEAGIAIAWVANKIRSDFAEASRLYYRLRNAAFPSQEAQR